MLKIISVFLLEKCFSISSYKQEIFASHFRRKTSNENKQFKEKKPWISNLYLIRQSFKGTVVNRALLSLHGGSLEITRTVPFRVVINC